VSSSLPDEDSDDDDDQMLSSQLQYSESCNKFDESEDTEILPPTQQFHWSGKSSKQARKRSIEVDDTEINFLTPKTQEPHVKRKQSRLSEVNETTVSQLQTKHTNLQEANVSQNNSSSKVQTKQPEETVKQKSAELDFHFPLSKAVKKCIAEKKNLQDDDQKSLSENALPVCRQRWEKL